MNRAEVEVDAIRIQLPQVGVAQAAGGDADADGDVWQRERELAMRAEQPQVAMLLDAPHEPPIQLQQHQHHQHQHRHHQHHQQQQQQQRQQLETVNAARRPRKKRSFWTMSKLAFPTQPERCAPIVNGWRAVEFVQPEQRSECFANYLLEHLNSKNYPNGQGLPTHHWGQL